MNVIWCGKVGSNESIIEEALNPNLAFPRRQLCARAYEFHAALSTDLFAQSEATCVNTIRTRAGNSVPTHPSCHSINGNVFRVPHHKELFSPLEWKKHTSSSTNKTKRTVSFHGLSLSPEDCTTTTTLQPPRNEVLAPEYKKLSENNTQSTKQ